MKNLCDYTESDFLELVRKICHAESQTEEEESRLVREFKRLTEHPAGSDLIFYPEDGKDDSPEGIVREVKEWRRANGKPGFKPYFLWVNTDNHAFLTSAQRQLLTTAGNR